MNLARGFRGWMNFRGKKKRWRLHASIYGDCTSCSELDNPLHVTRGAQTRRNGSQEDSDPERERERSRLRLVNNSVRIKVVARAILHHHERLEVGIASLG